jgi:NADH-quinone oxidoreductase subunit G
MSPFRHGMSYADVLLPIAPFTKLPGRRQQRGTRADFHGVVQPLGETRPGWKVLRVLGTLLSCRDSMPTPADDVRASVRRGWRDFRQPIECLTGGRREARDGAFAARAWPMSPSISPIALCVARHRCSTLRMPRRQRRECIAPV